MGWSEVANSLKQSDELLKATLNCDEEKVAELSARQRIYTSKHNSYL